MTDILTIARAEIEASKGWPAGPWRPHLEYDSHDEPEDAAWMGSFETDGDGTQNVTFGPSDDCADELAKRIVGAIERGPLLAAWVERALASAPTVLAELVSSIDPSDLRADAAAVCKDLIAEFLRRLDFRP